MEFALLISVITCLMLRNYSVSRSVIYPPFLFSALWLLVLSVYQCGLVEINPLHGKLMFLLGLGTLSFSVGGEIARLIPQRLISIRLKIGDNLGKARPVHLTKILILIAAFVGMIFVAHNTISLGLKGGAGSIMTNARNAGIEESNSGAKFAIVNYVWVWANLSATLFLIEKRDRLFWLMAGIALAAAVFTTGRVPILQLFCMLTTVQLIKTNKLRFLSAFRFARIPILIFLLLYIVLIFTNKDTSGMSGGVVGIVTYFVVGYIIGPTAAMDYVVQHAREYMHQPQHTFKFPLEIGAALHLWTYTPPPLLDIFIQVPFPANVYTGYKFYFTDFGFAGCILAVGIIGFLQTLLYRKALTGSSLGIYFYAFTVFPLVMFIFDDIYSATGEMLNAVLFGCIFMALRSLRFLPATSQAHFSMLPRQVKSTWKLSLLPRVKKLKP